MMILYIPMREIFSEVKNTRKMTLRFQITESMITLTLNFPKYKFVLLTITMATTTRQYKKE